MRKRLKAVLERLDAGELTKAQAEARLETLLGNFVNRLERNDRLDADEAQDARGFLATANRKSFLDGALDLHRTLKRAAADEGSMVSRLHARVYAGRFTEATADARLERALDRRIDKLEKRGRVTEDEADALHRAADRLKDAGAALSDFKGFRKFVLGDGPERAENGDATPSATFELYKPRRFDDLDGKLRHAVGDVFRLEPLDLEPPAPVPVATQGGTYHSSGSSIYMVYDRPAPIIFAPPPEDGPSFSPTDGTALPPGLQGGVMMPPPFALPAIEAAEDPEPAPTSDAFLL